MRALLADRRIIGSLPVLALAQIVGWGTIGLPAIVGTQMAADLGMDIAAIFAGTSVLYVAMGIAAPFLAEPLANRGARSVMAVGSLAAAPGFILLSLAHGPSLYFLAWIVLGIAGSAALTTSAYVMLNEIAGQQARSAIGALMLLTGLSSSIFWPITAIISSAIGWRDTCLVYAALMVAVCFPLYFFGLPRGRAMRDGPTAKPSDAGQVVTHEPTFLLVVAAIALNAFVTFGLAAVFIELLKSVGLADMTAIAFGSSLGIIQVSARAIDFLGGDRWDGITTGLFAGSLLPVSMLLLLLGNGSHWSVVAFIVLYGLGSGALAVSRATIPLVFYEQSAYARASSRLALPLNLISAAAPPTLAGILSRFGSGMMIAVTMVCSLAALSMLALLARRRGEIKRARQA